MTASFYPKHHKTRKGLKRLFKQFSSRRHSEPRRAGDARVDSRGRRAGLFAVARLRGGFRQSRPARRVRRRRWRSGDRPARHQLALEQVPQSGPRRGRAAHPALERLQDRRPHRVGAHSPRRAGSALSRLWFTPYFVEGDDPEKMHQLMAATLDTAVAEIQRIQNDARANGFKGRPRWPMLVLRSPKGWTGPKGGRRPSDRGHVPSTRSRWCRGMSRS